MGSCRYVSEADTHAIAHTNAEALLRI